MVNRKDNSTENESGVFATLDKIMRELDKTRKIFIFMFFTIMILPITTIMIFVSTLDDTFPSRQEYRQNVQELNIISQQMKNYFVQLEKLPLEEREVNLQILLNSPEYKESVLRIDEISNSINTLQNNEKPFFKKYKSEIRIITFILSIIWISLGIRQYIVLSKWGKRYNKFKEKQKELDKKFDDD
ncbi:MAG: hypothetical protein ACPKQO_10350 [Nitrososphaeraceae archaeon]